MCANLASYPPRFAFHWLLYRISPHLPLSKSSNNPYTRCPKYVLYLQTCSGSLLSKFYMFVVKEVAKEVSLCLYRRYCPELLSTNHINAELYRALHIVAKFGRHTASSDRARYGLRRLRNHITPYGAFALHFQIRHKSHFRSDHLQQGFQTLSLGTAPRRFKCLL